MRSFTVPLHADGSRTPVRLVGGKGASLAALTRAGLPVPPGYVISTEAFAAFVRANDLAPARRTAAAAPELAVPAAVAREVVAAYRRLPRPAGVEPAVAVRSSATTEDLDRLSLAGALATVLNVRGEAAVLAAVIRCWSSVWHDRAARRGVDPRTELAVVVQQMVAADCAGVAFTVNPLTGEDELVLNASWGLGEAVVQGRVTPDVVIVDKRTATVRRLTVGAKELMTVATDGGTTEVAVDPGRRLRPALRPDQVTAVVELGRAAEALFGQPQDIEWAIGHGRLHVLQSRPITTRPPAPVAPGDDAWPAVGESAPQAFDLWTQVNVGEIWPDPVSPLVWSGVPHVVGTTIRYALRGLDRRLLARVQWARRLYGRVYYNEGAIAHLFTHALGLPASLVDRALGGRRAARARPGDGRFRPVRLLRRLPFLLRFGLSQIGSGRRLTALAARVDRWVDEDARQRPAGSDSEIRREVDRWMERFLQVMKVNTEVSISSLVAFGLLEQLAGLGPERRDLTQELVAGLAEVRTAELGTALWRMARELSRAELAGVATGNDPRVALARLRDLPAAGPFRSLLSSFLHRHGHHCANEGEWLNPRWAEAPEHVIAVVAAYLRAGDRPDPGQLRQAGRRRAQEVIARVTGELGPLRRVAVRLVLARVRTLVQLRDLGKSCYTRLLHPIRRGYAAVGTGWAARGWLADPDDIFFLTAPEVERIVAAGDPAAAGLDVSRIVRERREAYEFWFGVEPPDVIGADHRHVTRADPVGHVLSGIPISGGRARGPVRVVHSPRDAALLQPGDVLVTRATDPGWTPHFPLLAAVVVEIGGQLSHAAIVAREYGVPAVGSVHRATRRLRPGQVITVDGTSGEIGLDSEATGEVPGCVA